MKIKHLLQLLLIAAVPSVVVSAANEARLLRFPATNGEEIAFSYAGDLYKVSINGGEAQRLTSHVGYEMFPRFSPDGKTIAFTGQYDGNTEVYKITADGGEPVRLTYTATNSRDDLGDRMGPNNIVMTWTPDGKSIVYRNRISDGFDGRLFTVSIDGGLSQRIPLPEGGFCSYSPDGKMLAYNRTMREFRTWKYYLGGMADDIWIYNPEKKTVDNITNNPAQDIFPMWVGNEIYFLSARDHIMNVFVYNADTKQTSKVTNFDLYDVKFPSTNGKMIVFENGGYIYKLDPATKKYDKVNITLNSDNIYARNEIKNGADNLNAASLTADGNRLAVTARGEVFNVPVEKGVTRNITRSAGANDREGNWSPDGKYIAYISDATGETEIYMQPADGSETIQLTKNNDTYIRNILWSNDSKKIVYSDRKNRLKMVDIATKAVTTIAEEPKGEFDDYSISPDNKWIAYTRPADNQFSIIYLYNLDTKKEYPVTDKWYSSNSPEFSTDGKYLIFASSRDFDPTYSQIEWNYAYNNMEGVYLALLSKDTPSPFMLKDGNTESAQKEAAAAPADSKKKGDVKVTKDDTKAAPAVTVNFDSDGIMDRIIHLPLDGGNYGNFFSDGKKVYYSGRKGTHVYDLEKQKDTEVCSARMFVAPGGKKAAFYKGNSIYVMDLPSGKADLDKAVDLSNMKINVDYSKEWAQIFDEAWRAYRDGFYEENMHGKDWKALKAKYEVLVPYAKTRIDLNYIIGEMISELQCGHAYVSPGEKPVVPRVYTGLLGAQVSKDKSGFYRIDKIYEGASWSDKLRSPLREAGVDAKVGEYVVAIDGIPTNTVNDMYQLLVGKANVPTELSLSSKAELAGARKVVINPLDNEYPLVHYEWVQNNIKTVEKASNGKIGYIYIPDMGPDGLNEFARYYYPQIDKEGLIIDDRANGGGNVSPMILERLNREVYRATMRRGSTMIGTIPDGTQVGPKVCLINKYSASDGDLFPWGFRALGIGKLVGMRTWGGIIGISGPLPYIDGTDIRVPFFTGYDPKTGDWIIENHGVDPDIQVDNDPIKEWNGEDQQLNAAIQEVMKQLPSRKPIPPVPAPRNWGDKK